MGSSGRVGGKGEGREGSSRTSTYARAYVIPAGESRSPTMIESDRRRGTAGKKPGEKEEARQNVRERARVR